MSSLAYAEATMRDALGAFIHRLQRQIEGWLPWYDTEAARHHDARTELIRLRSIAARQAAEVRRENAVRTIRGTVRAMQQR